MRLLSKIYEGIIVDPRASKHRAPIGDITLNDHADLDSTHANYQDFLRTKRVKSCNLATWIMIKQ
jgi:hypothetical protein